MNPSASRLSCTDEMDEYFNCGEVGEISGEYSQSCVLDYHWSRRDGGVCWRRVSERGGGECAMVVRRGEHCCLVASSCVVSRVLWERPIVMFANW